MISGHWHDQFYENGKRVTTKWRKNLVVASASKALAAGLSTTPTPTTFSFSGQNWVQASKAITKTAGNAFVNYNRTNSDRVYIFAGTNAIKGFYTVTNTHANPDVDDGIVVDATLASTAADLTNNDIAGTIFQAPPLLHNLWLALGYGDSSWDIETPAPQSSATALVSEHYRKRPSYVSHMQEYEGLNTYTGPDQNKLTAATFQTLGGQLIGQVIEVIDGVNSGDQRTITSIATDTVTLSSNMTSVATATTYWRVAVPVTAATGVLDIRTVFNEAQANASVREMALFGGNATQEKDSGNMINLIRHAKVVVNINPVDPATFYTRTMRLRLQIV